MQQRCWLSEGTHRTRSRSYEGPEIASPNIATARQPVVNGGSTVVLSVMYTNQKNDLMTCGQYLNTELINNTIQKHWIPTGCSCKMCNFASWHSECSLLFPVALINTLTVTMAATAYEVTMANMNAITVDITDY